MSGKNEDTPSIVIGNAEATHVAIRPLYRTHPEATDPDDGNWLESHIDVEVGAFKGGFRSSLRAEDFPRFLEALRSIEESLGGRAEFETMEGQLQLALEGNGRGQISVEGKARDAPGSENELKFEFEIDQSYLPAIARTVEEVVTRFPVVGSRRGES